MGANDMTNPREQDGGSAAEDAATARDSDMAEPQRQGFAPPGDDLYALLPALGQEVLEEAVPQALLDAAARIGTDSRD